MDDVLSETATEEDAVKNSRAVLTILDKHHVKAKRSKFNFGREVPYAGIILTREGVLPSKKIISSILIMGQPTNITQLQSFLGFVNQVQSWYSDIAQSTLKLRELLKKDNKFEQIKNMTKPP